MSVVPEKPANPEGSKMSLEVETTSPDGAKTDMSVLTKPVLHKALLDACAGKSFSGGFVKEIFEAILDSGPDNSMVVAGLLCALQAKGLSADLLIPAVKVISEKAVPVPAVDYPVIDCCGTGGDVKYSFNVSTAAGLVAASAGAKVSKHGNRSVSSKCGSADVLAEIGVCLDHCADVYAKAMETVGFGFVHARLHHQSLSRIAPIRHALGVPTMFNMLGPLLNPANPEFQMIGTYSERNQQLLADCLQKLGRQRAWVVRAEDGTDELSLFCRNFVVEVRGESRREFNLNPVKYGLGVDVSQIEEIKVDTPSKAAQMLWMSLYDADSAVGKMARLNASAVLYISGVCEHFKDAVEATEAAQREGRSTETLKAYLALFA